MKNSILILALAAGSLLSSVTSAHEIGFILGSATGLSGKYSLPMQNRALDFGLGYKINSTSSLTLHSDYLIENARFIRVQTADVLAVYYGLGARFININSDGVNKDKTSFGPRAPLGVDYKINDPDITAFGEAAVALDVVPETLVEIQVGIGLRLRF